MNVGKTVKESCDTEERHAGEAYDGGSSVMSSKVGCCWKSQRSSNLLRGEAAFGCVVGRRDLSYGFLSFSIDYHSHIT